MTVRNTLTIYSTVVQYLHVDMCKDSSVNSNDNFSASLELVVEISLCINTQSYVITKSQVTSLSALISTLVFACTVILVGHLDAYFYEYMNKLLIHSTVLRTQSSPLKSVQFCQHIRQQAKAQKSSGVSLAITRQIY